jgi:hypothetical protein
MDHAARPEHQEMHLLCHLMEEGPICDWWLHWDFRKVIADRKAQLAPQQMGNRQFLIE